MMPSHSPLISSVILTLNEEANLSRCAESLRWCHRICVVDSGSTDGTARQAQTLGLEFYEHRQRPPFLIDRQRNWALEHCGFRPGEWVLFLDADETVPSQLAQFLQELAVQPESPGQPEAYEMTPRYLFWGRWLRRTQGFPNWHPRLVRAGRARFTSGVWEEFAAGPRVGRIAEPYDHHANSKGFRDWLERHDRYSSWDAEGIVRFLESGTAESLGTGRKLRERTWAARHWRWRPLARFAHLYLWRRGFLEGKEALVFCLSMAFYEWMTVMKVGEALRKKRGFPL